MAEQDENKPERSMIKIVYFDEQSASDHLDISAGGKTASTSEDVKKRATDMHAKVETNIAAKFSWLPFLGGTAEAGGGVDVSRVGQSILSKTLSNTILTDYLEQVVNDSQIRRLTELTVTAPTDSMAYIKMYTPYMIIARTEEAGIDLARLDEALERAKGYYELVGTNSAGEKYVLRFNIRAFRNNYGLVDLAKMKLVYHGVLVGKTTEAELRMQAEMSGAGESEPFSVQEALNSGSATIAASQPVLDVYDVILAGVEHEK